MAGDEKCVIRSGRRRSIHCSPAALIQPVRTAGAGAHATFPTHGGSAETARGLEREPRQYCPAVSAVLHWSRGRPWAARRVIAGAEDSGGSARETNRFSNGCLSGPFACILIFADEERGSP